MEKKRVIIRISLDAEFRNFIEIIYYQLNGEGDIVEMTDSFIVDDIVSCITELYVLNVLKKKDYVEDLLLIFSNPNNFVNQIFQLGVVLGSLSKDISEDIKIELL